MKSPRPPRLLAPREHLVRSGFSKRFKNCELRYQIRDRYCPGPTLFCCHPSFLFCASTSSQLIHLPTLHELPSPNLGRWLAPQLNVILSSFLIVTKHFPFTSEAVLRILERCAHSLFASPRCNAVGDKAYKWYQRPNPFTRTGINRIIAFRYC